MVHPWYSAGSGIALAGLLMLTLPKRRRFAGLLAVVLSFGMIAVSGCGGGSTGGTTQTNNSPAETYGDGDRFGDFRNDGGVAYGYRDFRRQLGRRGAPASFEARPSPFPVSARLLIYVLRRLREEGWTV